MQKKRLSAVLLLLFALVTRVQSESPREAERVIANPLFAEVGQEIEAWVREEGTPSVSVAVFKDNAIIWQQAFGYADAQTRKAATPKTLYPLASVTKPFTATAIMMLVEKGKIGLDDPVRRYFSADPFITHFQLKREITIRDLLRHTSGMKGYCINLYDGEPCVGDERQPDFHRYADVFFQPGERFEYSNIGYALLAEIVAKVSGMPYEQFLKEKVLLPLGMRHTRMGIDPALRGEYARLRGGDGEPVPLVYSDTPGAANLYSTAHDLVQFGRLHLATGDASSLLTPATLQSMRGTVDPAVYYADPCHPYGLGWFFETSRDGSAAFWHEGGMDGCHALLKIVPARNVVVVVLTNTTFTANKAVRLGDLILGKLLPDYRAVGECGPREEATPVKDAPRFTGEWAGRLHTHERDLELSLRFSEAGEVVVAFENQQTRSFVFAGQPIEQKTLLNHATVMGNHLRGWLLEGLIPAREWRSRFHVVSLDLELDKTIMQGVASGWSANQTREGALANFYVELHRQSTLDEQALLSLIDKEGIAAGLDMCRRFRQENGGFFSANEARLTGVGYVLLNRKKMKEAVAIFELLVESRPQVANNWDSLGEAYVADGRKTEAIAAYEHALRLKPGLPSARAALAVLHK